KILKENNFHYLLGDISDEEIFERINFDNTKVIISTSPNFEDNMTILERVNKLKQSGSDLRVVFTAQDEKDMKLFYKKGADYVILPHASSGKYLGKLLEADPELKNIVIIVADYQTLFTYMSLLEINFNNLCKKYYDK
ncbi:MAG: NAD-binding protein, partial [Candidatus Subteraquimicrobiales bacterium]|nr:NAD-binding protein [Candidatus Subteraquimicrobiales bacterium]